MPAAPIPMATTAAITGRVPVVLGVPHEASEIGTFRVGPHRDHLTAGVAGTACNTNAPPVVVYCASRRWDPIVLHATLITAGLIYRYVLRRHAYGIGKVKALGYRPAVPLDDGTAHGQADAHPPDLRAGAHGADPPGLARAQIVS